MIVDTVTAIKEYEANQLAVPIQSSNICAFLQESYSTGYST